MGLDLSTLTLVADIPRLGANLYVWLIYFKPDSAEIFGSHVRYFWISRERDLEGEGDSVTVRTCTLPTNYTFGPSATSLVGRSLSRYTTSAENLSPGLSHSCV